MSGQLVQTWNDPNVLIHRHTKKLAWRFKADGVYPKLKP